MQAALGMAFETSPLKGSTFLDACISRFRLENRSKRVDPFEFKSMSPNPNRSSQSSRAEGLVSN